MENTPEQTAHTPPQPPMQQAVPYSTSVLVMGILSIVGCWCWGLPGVVLGIIGLVQSGKGKEAYNQNPALYTPGSLKNLNAGRVCSIIGLCLSGFVMLSLIIKVIFFGAMLTALPWHSFMK
jgi:M penetrans paralogue family 26